MIAVKDEIAKRIEQLTAIEWIGEVCFRVRFGEGGTIRKFTLDFSEDIPLKNGLTRAKKNDIRK